MINCPHCKSEISEEAAVCRHCTHRVKGVVCPDCLSVCHSKASVCKWCNKRLLTEEKKTPISTGFEITSELLPTLLSELKFTPQKAVFSKEKIIITTHALFGLTKRDEEILWEKVAGFSHRSGIFWDTIVIETRGQTGGSIRCLSKANSAKIRKTLQALEK